MYQNHISYNPFSGKLKHHSPNAGNSLGIRKTNYIWDRKKQQLVILMETSQLINQEVRAILKGNRLILEAPLTSSYNKPFRTHLIEKEMKDEFEDGLMVIGFSELKLKFGYHYNLISCQALDPNLIKIILGFTQWGRKKEN